MLFFGWFACNSSLAAFCLEELRAAAATLEVDIRVQECLPWLRADSSQTAFCVFDVASVAVARQLAGRCVLLRAVHLLIAAAASVEDLLACIAGTSDGGIGEAKWLRGMAWPDDTILRPADCTVQVETIGRHYTLEEKTALATRVSVAMRILPDASRPRATEQRPHRLSFVVEHAIENAPTGALASWLPCGRVLRVFCGALVSESNRQHLLATYDLKRRPYIGTTSMPSEPAFVMVHLAHVRRGNYVFDPFCGTGSILIAAAHYGAVTLGADADARVMRGGSLRCKASKQQQQQRELAVRSYTQDTLERAGINAAEAEAPSMWTNFKLYGLTPPDRVRMNFANWHAALRPCNMHDREKGPTDRGDRGFLDAIVTDPPYGIREPRKKATRLTGEKVAMEEGNDIPACYPVSSIVLDLMLFAAESLVLGGRLVFWYPTTTTTRYTDDELPTHPSLRLVCDIPQRVSLKIVRHLIVMEKTRPVPFPPPSRASCAATRQAPDLRALMDATDLPDNADYMHYRSKLLRKRDSTRRYFTTTTTSSSLSTHGDDRPDEAKGERRKLSRAERQDIIVANRERNLQHKRQQQKQQQLTWREENRQSDNEGGGERGRHSSK
ncbi:putative methyltransferase [Trypanosoma cruzi]|nr:putative methyltransferase [Trypanosoma cruzi]RNF14125.1 putative methyltransferase [Trypanosoma cruzi]